jgi:hypothetical protein
VTGPRDEDLDRAVEDDRLHEGYFGFPLNRAHEVYDYDDRDGIDRADELDQDDDEEGRDE